jgi:hypothetical protein
LMKHRRMQIENADRVAGNVVTVFIRLSERHSRFNPTSR